jgi:hypothetical protein
MLQCENETAFEGSWNDHTASGKNVRAVDLECQPAQDATEG